ncbi:YdcF family protein [Actinoplanes sp. CA-030573]|uniref:YdcF family protein n=1 Tax=Actinoplanes sp. CA-030573 TaxID=3239898 RepID=UPI003D933A61
MSFQIVAGTEGLGLDAVAHVLVPGRGRDESGFGLTPEAIDRVTVAAELYREIAGPKGGRVVCSGYKSPIDRKGAPWSSDAAPGVVFSGMPEAELMRRELIEKGVPAEAIRAERRSIDTVTNFLRSELEGHFGDDRPVAIVAQYDHLCRMITVIAPRTLRRQYLGVVAPSRSPDDEGWLPTLVSRVVAARLPDDSQAAIDVATARAARIWRAAEITGMRSYH